MNVLNPFVLLYLLQKDCQLSVKQVNPRQYVAQIPQLSNVEVWFQRPKDIVRKLLSGDLDLGIVGLNTVSEYGQAVIENVPLKQKIFSEIEKACPPHCILAKKIFADCVIRAHFFRQLLMLVVLQQQLTVDPCLQKISIIQMI